MSEFFVSGNKCYFPNKKKYKLTYEFGKIYLNIKSSKYWGYLSQDQNKIIWNDRQIWTKTNNVLVIILGKSAFVLI